MTPSGEEGASPCWRIVCAQPRTSAVGLAGLTAGKTDADDQSSSP